MVAGTWRDAYTGELLEFTDLRDSAQAQQIPIDHVVALALAHRYGARAWSPDRRREFANDLDNLQPAARLTNLSKSDDDAAAWRPAAPYQCAYATRYVTIKHRYALAVDLAEKRALQEMLTRCP